MTPTVMVEAVTLPKLAKGDGRLRPSPDNHALPSRHHQPPCHHRLPAVGGPRPTGPTPTPVWPPVDTLARLRSAWPFSPPAGSATSEPDRPVENTCSLHADNSTQSLRQHNLKKHNITQKNSPTCWSNVLHGHAPNRSRSDAQGQAIQAGYLLLDRRDVRGPGSAKNPGRPALRSPRGRSLRAQPSRIRGRPGPAPAGAAPTRHGPWPRTAFRARPGRGGSPLDVCPDSALRRAFQFRVGGDRCKTRPRHAGRQPPSRWWTGRFRRLDESWPGDPIRRVQSGACCPSIQPGRPRSAQRRKSWMSNPVSTAAMLPSPLRSVAAERSQCPGRGASESPRPPRSLCRCRCTCGAAPPMQNASAGGERPPAAPSRRSGC